MKNKERKYIIYSVLVVAVAALILGNTKESLLLLIIAHLVDMKYELQDINKNVSEK